MRSLFLPPGPRRFENPSGVRRSFDFFTILQRLRARSPGVWPAWIASEPAPAPPAAVEGDGLRVTFVNHSTFLIQTAGLNLLTDPFFSERTSPVGWIGPKRVRPPGIRFADLPKIDAVLLSHDHYDHLDGPTLRILPWRDRPRVLCGLGVARALEAEHVSGGSEHAWWESTALSPDVRATFVPTEHFSGRGLRDRDTTLWGAWMLEAPGGKLLFGGDTGYGEHFKAIHARFGPVDVALLPIGAYEPYWFMSPVHMNPEAAVQAHLDLQSRFSIGMHFGTVRLTDEGCHEPPERLAAELARLGLPADRFVTPGFGQAFMGWGSQWEDALSG